MKTIHITVPENIPHSAQNEVYKLIEITLLKSKYYEDVKDSMIKITRSGEQFAVGPDVVGPVRALSLVVSMERLWDHFFDDVEYQAG